VNEREIERKEKRREDWFSSKLKGSGINLATIQQRSEATENLAHILYPPFLTVTATLTSSSG